PPPPECPRPFCPIHSHPLTISHLATPFLSHTFPPIDRSPSVQALSAPYVPTHLPRPVYPSGPHPSATSPVPPDGPAPRPRPVWSLPARLGRPFLSAPLRACLLAPCPGPEAGRGAFLPPPASNPLSQLAQLILLTWAPIALGKGPVEEQGERREKGGVSTLLSPPPGLGPSRSFSCPPLFLLLFAMASPGPRPSSQTIGSFRGTRSSPRMGASGRNFDPEDIAQENGLPEATVRVSKSKQNVVLERHRRKRISRSCEQLRTLLPRFDGRREDMASILEMAVKFLELTHALVPSEQQTTCSKEFGHQKPLCVDPEFRANQHSSILRNSRKDGRKKQAWGSFSEEQW
uniref:Spermatosis and oosis specific basic helix-loop-helix 1 n=1 Tax=Ornithorhynchus anatinus TaxID=9258 RepID=A0A6I8NI32_ORNAN